MKSVIIADHHPMTRLGISSLISEGDSFHVIGTVTNGEELESVLRGKSPDILIMELDLPGLAGMNSLRKIKELSPSSRILVFSRHPEEMYAVSAIKAGAAAYISKESSVDIFRQALGQVGRGGIFMNKVISETLSDSHKNGRMQFKKLSTREIEVLNLLSNGRKNKEIAEVLDINQKTVSTYKTRLLRKLQVRSLADLINHSRLMQGHDQ